MRASNRRYEGWGSRSHGKGRGSEGQKNTSSKNLELALVSKVGVRVAGGELGELKQVRGGIGKSGENEE